MVSRTLVISRKRREEGERVKIPHEWEYNDAQQPHEKYRTNPKQMGIESCASEGIHANVVLVPALLSTSAVNNRYNL
jgi:hypothetical protein